MAMIPHSDPLMSIIYLAPNHPAKGNNDSNPLIKGGGLPPDRQNPPSGPPRNRLTNRRPTPCDREHSGGVKRLTAQTHKGRYVYSKLT
jgi:hypothetical protein